jgi:preprotein translocase subunit YajC
MFISPAYAQAAEAAGSVNPIMQFAPFVLIIVIFYFLLIRPQQKKAKEHRDMVTAVRRGDVVITAGGLIGKVSKVIDDREIQVEIAEGVKVKILKSTLQDIRSKTEPAEDKSASS